MFVHEIIDLESSVVLRMIKPNIWVKKINSLVPVRCGFLLKCVIS